MNTITGVPEMIKPIRQVVSDFWNCGSPMVICQFKYKSVNKCVYMWIKDDIFVSKTKYPSNTKQ